MTGRAAVRSAGQADRAAGKGEAAVTVLRQQRRSVEIDPVCGLREVERRMDPRLVDSMQPTIVLSPRALAVSLSRSASVSPPALSSLMLTA